MKKVFIALILVLLFCSPIAYAHSGGTDSNGGHWDSSSNSYHYHHGYPAHKHTNGECPYDFNDNVDSNKSHDSDDTEEILAVIVVILIISIPYWFPELFYGIKEGI